jgi:hypothetical protein
MFSESQQAKIKKFATVAKVTNECFNKCVNYDNNIPLNDDIKSISKQESNCLKNCSFTYLELNNNIDNQLFKDLKAFNAKNKEILEKKT